jgi:amino acid adenylation domain-containing protein
MSDLREDGSPVLGTSALPDHPSTLHGRVERAAQRWPDATAVVGSRRTLTFADLETEASALADALAERGVGRGQIVGISLRRGPEQVIAVLAVLKSGAAYVPLDVDLPIARAATLRERCRCEVVITERDFVGADSSTRVERGSALSQRGGGRRGAVRPASCAAGPSDLAYVLFTSGSTGEPKGVMVEHRAALTTVESISDHFDLTPGDVALGVSSLDFDPSVQDIFGTLGSGATLVIPDADLAREPPHWLDLMHRHGVTHWNSVPLLLDLLVSHMAESGCGRPPSFRRIMLGGEFISSGLRQRMREQLPGVRAANVYGPTESCICSTWGEFDPAEDLASPMSCGPALRGETIYICDEGMQVLGAGEHGEVVIGGLGLARGYLGDPVRTGESFISLGDTGDRAYRTGDRGYLSDDGRLTLLGRDDRQIKINGVRIELGEVEATLLRHPLVRDAAVIAPRSREGERVMVAWVCADADLVTARLVAHLREHLPPAFVPTVVLLSGPVPKTPHGKNDYGALELRWRDQNPEEAGPPQTGRQAQRDDSRVARLVREAVSEFTGAEPVLDSDDFFSLGGNSLAAGRLVARIRARLGIDISSRLPFEHPGIGAMVRAVEALEAGPGRTADSPVPTRRSARRSRASYGQEAVWFVDQLAPGNRAYHAQSAVVFDGTIHPDALRRALQAVVDTHEIYRTTFAPEGHLLMQTVHPKAPVSFRVVDLRFSRGGAGAAFEELARAEARVLMRIDALPLARWVLARTADDEWRVLQTEHHFVHDGWSAAVLWRHVGIAYRQVLEHRSVTLPASTQFGVFSQWQRWTLGGGRLQAGLAHWRADLVGSEPVDLVMADARPSRQTFDGACVRVRVPQAVYARARALARVRRISLFSVLCAVFAVFLRHHTGSPEVSFGTWMSNRGREEFDETIGMLVNMVVLRFDVDEASDFLSMMSRASDRVAEAVEFQDIPFDEVVRAVAPARDSSRNPLVSTAFSFHDSAMPDFDWPSAAGNFVERHNGSAKFDLNIVAVPRAEQRGNTRDELASDDHLDLIWEYSSDILDADRVRRMSQQFEVLLEQLVSRPDSAIGTVGIATPEDIAVHQAMVGPTWPSPPLDVSAAFADRVRGSSDRVAIVDDREALTYGEVGSCVESMAAVLAARGIRRGSRVALLLDRDFRLPVAMLAVLRLGAAFIPVDPSLPSTRIRAACDDADVDLVVTSERAPAGVSCPALVLADVDLRGGSTSVQVPDVSDDDAAYILFTSGSTGTPKGVVITRGSLANLLQSVPQTIGLNQDDRLLAVTTAGFDISVLELLAPLRLGAAVIVAPAGASADGDLLGSLLRRHVVTVLQATPITWRILIESGWSAGRPLTVLCGGEALPPDLARALLDTQVNGGGAVWNLYGPTETTIWSSAHRVEEADLKASTSAVTIGRPLHETSMLLLDEYGNPVPVGLPGELYIGGRGVARGYLDDTLTQERFVRMPRGEDLSHRYFRTGDLMRLRADARLEFLRRNDRQVKIRGFRVELAEIETAIRQTGLVTDCAVVVRSDPQALVAFVEGLDLRTDPRGLLELLEDRLPRYMVPARAVVVDHLPSTASGKIDHGRLLHTPLPEVPSSVDRSMSAAEQLVHEMWVDLLGRSDFGIDDDFFAVGGHSLLAIRLVERVRAATGSDIALVDVFDAATVRGLADRIEGSVDGI